MVRGKRVSGFFMLFVLALYSGFFGQSARADDHLVTSADLHQMLLNSANSRQDDIGRIRKFLSSDSTHKTLGRNNHLLVKVEKALPYLSDEELKRLAVQTQKFDQDVAAGSLTNQQLTYIIIALATAVIILIIVAA